MEQNTPHLQGVLRPGADRVGAMKNQATLSAPRAEVSSCRIDGQQTIEART